MCKTMDVTKHMANNAKATASSRGVLSMPLAMKGKKHNSYKLGIQYYNITGRPIPQDTHDIVEEFYTDDRFSVNLPGMKDFISIKNAEHQRVHVQKRLILLNLKELFEQFRMEHSDIKIGFSVFASFRPTHCVLAGASGTHTVCVCALHQNVKLMMIGNYFEHVINICKYFNRINCSYIFLKAAI